MLDSKDGNEGEGENSLVQIALVLEVYDCSVV